MEYNYNKLWKMLIDKNMSKKELSEQSGVSGATLARMKNNRPVTMNVLVKLCGVLNCRIDDIVKINL
ncbi:helix-turn-helix domain-containing protein [[Clostridium] fimetarium]|uniref:DNA-binding transcriptional regulator, XRE family n=1 Tax=[Clostridium] fimetarium TaxID=99656 RepID=A0A1I0Q079_9FIRM|nr:helix-turn-helix transcriptional regulator [[Clostridium] fimetarium]SEW20147.1 DNA-binding transcriptional regulator, XRE family [[Clostridium] fimetarium]